MAIIFRIRANSDSGRSLTKVGPMIPAIWKGSRGQIRGNLLLDTGAGEIAIDDSVARELQLPVESTKKDVHGLGGNQSLSVYRVLLQIPVELLIRVPNAPPNSKAAIGIPVLAHGVVGLRDGHEAKGLKATDGLPIIGILGRIFLQFTEFTYDGQTGALTIDIDDSVQRPSNA